MKSVEAGDVSEMRVLEKLIALGFRDVRMMWRGPPYDLEGDGLGVEVKYANLSNRDGCTILLRNPGSPVPPVVAYGFCIDGLPGRTDWAYSVMPGAIDDVLFR